MWKKEITYDSAKMFLFYLVREQGELYLKHNYQGNDKKHEMTECFLLPSKYGNGNKSCRIYAARPFRVVLHEDGMGAEIRYEGNRDEISLVFYPGVPHCDIMGNFMKLDFRYGKEFEETAYQFYWRTLLPSVVEKTSVSGHTGCDGYVVSTLQWTKYAGTYPDVDHEFQIKGRIALGSEFELSLVRRMIELQLKLMEEDPERLYRDPCSLQPDGTREYHIRRNSMDNSANAVMFLVTGNIEIIEAADLYLSATGDWEWWEEHKEGLENALSLVEDCIDRQGRLWSDVYYEDQVIKDGRECMSAAFAANAMKKMALLEERAGDKKRRDYYLQLEKKLCDAMIKPLPEGFWSEENKRFADWVDRNSKCHDHVHLLANELPVLFGYASRHQSKMIEELLEEYFQEFQRFPTFVAGRIGDYTEDEIGDGGPYDLCAAGRYWCWDFAYWLSQKRKDILEQQLLLVCRQAAEDDYLMGERYDMNYVYYQSTRNWHGAAHYYEYPCVFLWNLIYGYLGVRKEKSADLKIAPMLNCAGKVTLPGKVYGISYEIGDGTFQVTNLQEKERSFLLCFSGEERKTVLKGGETYVWQQ